MPGIQVSAPAHTVFPTSLSALSGQWYLPAVGWTCSLPGHDQKTKSKHQMTQMKYNQSGSFSFFFFKSGTHTSNFTGKKNSKLKWYLLCPFAPYPWAAHKKTKSKGNATIFTFIILSTYIFLYQILIKYKSPLNWSTFSCIWISIFCKRNKSNNVFTTHSRAKIKHD